VFRTSWITVALVRQGRVEFSHAEIRFRHQNFCGSDKDTEIDYLEMMSCLSLKNFENNIMVIVCGGGIMQYFLVLMMSQLFC
jgi:hypothetical protein